MKLHLLSIKNATAKPRAVALAATLAIASVLSQVASAQKVQLTLADLVIGLRSKKLTLPERNKILTEATKVRGVTFVLTPEIEKELESTGADKQLIAAIRQKGAIVKASAAVEPKSVPPPAAVSTPPPPDHAFYQKRAANYVAKGDNDLALADYSKAIEMNPADPVDYLGRGLVHYAKKSYERAIADFGKAIELNPKNSSAYLNRAFAKEKLGQSDQALADFQKAVDVDPANESAKLNLRRLQDNELKAVAKAKELEAASQPVTPPATTPVVPEFVSLGQLTAAHATRMVAPTYSEIARKTGIEGRVTVEIAIDAEGNVTDAKVVSGPVFLRQSAEDAARRSKFKPTVISGQPVKAKGVIVYNFTRSGGE